MMCLVGLLFVAMPHGVSADTDWYNDPRAVGGVKAVLSGMDGTYHGSLVLSCSAAYRPVHISNDKPLMPSEYSRLIHMQQWRCSSWYAMHRSS